MKRIILTVTNDLSFDQRMMRICDSLAKAGYSVLLVGRKLRYSIPLRKQSYHQKRLPCFFSKGKLFYVEYNLRLFLFLLTRKTACICAIDLDTIIPCYWASVLRRTKRVYDAHELFTEMDEIISRPAIHRTWLRIEKSMVPRFRLGYTVCDSIASEFRKRYNVNYQVIRNVPVPYDLQPKTAPEKYILYQGAVNKGRGLKKLAEAMREVSGKLYICGEGNFFDTLRDYVKKEGLEEKVLFTGYLEPTALREMTQQAYIAVNPFEATGLNQYLSLANKFFDYIQAGIPQVTMNYPEYRKINDEFGVAVLIEDLQPSNLAGAINNLLENDVLHEAIRERCLRARLQLNWEKEEAKLVQFYQQEVFGLE